MENKENNLEKKTGFRNMENKMKTLKNKIIKIEGKKDSRNNQKDTFGSVWKGFNTSVLFPTLTFGARVSPLVFFNDVVNIPKALAAYAITGSFMDMAEVINRIYKGELETYEEIEQKQIQGKPYSCFEKHIFYDIPKKIYNTIKKEK